MYGSLHDSGLSYTEMEHDFAVKSGIPILGFVRSVVEEFKSLATAKDPEKIKILEKLRDKVIKKT